MMKATQVSRVSRQIHVIRISRPDVHPIEREERVDSRIPSSVDSWLSSVPSIKETKVQELPKQPITIQPSINNTVQDQSLFRRGCMSLTAVVIIVLLICSIVGVVLAVKLQSTTTTTATTITTTIGTIATSSQ